MNVSGSALPFEVFWRLRLSDGTEVRSGGGEEAAGLRVRAEAGRRPDGTIVCGPLRIDGPRAAEVEEVLWPCAAVPCARGARFLFSGVGGGSTMGELRPVDPAGRGPGDAIVRPRNSPGFRFCALVGPDGRSLYLDSRETDSRPVTMCLFAGDAPGEAVLAASHPMPGTVSGGVVRPFRGGWFDAAAIYRDWARAQRWALAALSPERRAVRARLREISAWFWNRGRADEALPAVEEFAAALDGGAALDWYWWHACPYDTGYPSYWPPREGEGAFRAAIARLHARGAFVQPYLNGMTWDADDPSWAEGGAADAIEPLSAVAYNPNIGHRLASVCGESPHLQARLRDVIARLAACGVDGVYLDMIAMAAFSRTCRNPRHSHTPGDGAAMARAWREFLEALRAEFPGFALSSEGAGEAFLGLFDSMIFVESSFERTAYCTAPGTDCVPAFNAVYHDAVASFGSYAMVDGVPPWDPLWPDARRWRSERPWEALFPDAFAVEVARGAAWGMQPTVHHMRPGASRDPRFEEDVRFFLDTARFHRGARDFLFDGEMRHPGALQCETRAVAFPVRGIYTAEADFKVAENGAVPAVMHSVWRAPDGRIAAALCNWTREPQPFSLSAPDLSASGILPARTWRLVP